MGLLYLKIRWLIDLVNLLVSEQGRYITPLGHHLVLLAVWNLVEILYLLTWILGRVIVDVVLLAVILLVN